MLLAAHSGLLPGTLLYFAAEYLTDGIRGKIRGRFVGAITLFALALLSYAMGGLCHGALMDWLFAPSVRPWYLTMLPPGIRPALDTPVMLVFLSIFRGLYAVPAVSGLFAICFEVRRSAWVRAAAALLVLGLLIPLSTRDSSPREPSARNLPAAQTSGKCPNFAGTYTPARTAGNTLWCAKPARKLVIEQSRCEWLTITADGKKSLPECITKPYCMVNGFPFLLHGRSVHRGSNYLLSRLGKEGTEAADTNLYRATLYIETTERFITIRRAARVHHRHASNLFGHLASYRMSNCRYERMND